MVEARASYEGGLVRHKVWILLVTSLIASACAGGDAASTTTTTAVLAAETTTTTVGLGSGSDTTSTTTTAPSATTTSAVTEAGGGSDCLVGTWNPDPVQLEDFLLTLYRPYASDASVDSGTIDLIFGEDSSFAQNYNGVAGSGTAAGTAITMEFTGGSFGTWEASGGQITITFEGSDIGVVVNGVPATAPGIPPGEVTAAFACDGSDLRIEPPSAFAGGFWPLHRDWMRSS